jgi:hypothetical protein
MAADLAQKESARKLADRQHFWETPKGFAAVVGALTVTIGALGGVLGYTIGRTPQQPPMFPPGTVITIPPAIK